MQKLLFCKWTEAHEELKIKTPRAAVIQHVNMQHILNLVLFHLLNSVKSGNGSAQAG